MDGMDHLNRVYEVVLFNIPEKAAWTLRLRAPCAFLLPETPTPEPDADAEAEAEAPC